MARTSCAACEQPITNGQQVTTAGTEVFHRACIGNAAGSVRTRLEHQVRDLNAEVGRLAGKLAFEEAREQRTSAALVATEHELEQQGNQLRIYNKELMDASAEISKLRRDLATSNVNAASQRTRAEAAEQALDSIARTAGSRQPPTVPDEKQDSADLADDSRKRAALLELE